MEKIKRSYDLVRKLAPPHGLGTKHGYQRAHVPLLKAVDLLKNISYENVNKPLYGRQTVNI